MNPKYLSSIIVSASVLIFFILVMPAFDQNRTLRGSIEERENILAEAEAISVQIRNLNQEIQGRVAEVNKLDQLLPKEKQVPEFLSGIESIVSGSGMTLSEMNLSALPGQSQVRKINGTLKLNGTYPAFVSFLDLFEKNLRLTEVAALDVSAQLIEGTRTLNYDVRFEINYLTAE